MKEKKIIKFNHKNDSWVTFEEFENFLIEKLNPEGEKKEEKEEKENQEKKSEEKKVEEKKDEDL